MINPLVLAWDVIDAGMADDDAETVRFGLTLLRQCGSAELTCWLCGLPLRRGISGNLCDTHYEAAHRPTRLEMAREFLRRGTAA